MGLDDVKTSIAGPDTTPPETYITSGPGPYTTSTSVSFGFSSNEEGSTFECKLTRAGASNIALSEVLEDWTRCTSPRSYSNLDYTYLHVPGAGHGPCRKCRPDTRGPILASDTSGAPRGGLQITSPPNNSYDSDGSFSVAGNAPAGSTVELFEGTTSRGTAKADSSSGSLEHGSKRGLGRRSHLHRKSHRRGGLHLFAFNSVTVTVDESAPTGMDKSAPTGTVTINDGASRTRSRSVTLALSATDPSPGSGVSQMRIANTQSGLSSATWETYNTTRPWTLTSGKGTKTVYAQYRDAAGNRSATVTDTITFRP